MILLVVYQFHFHGWITNVLHSFKHNEIGTPGLSFTKSEPKKLQFTNKITDGNIFVFQWGIIHQSAIFTYQASWGWARRHLFRNGWSYARHSEFNHGNEIDKRPTRTGEFSKNFRSEFQKSKNSKNSRGVHAVQFFLAEKTFCALKKWKN